MSERGEELGPAARALAEAVTALTRAVGTGLADASTEVGEQLASSLRDASRDLAQASTRVRRSMGGRRQEREQSRERSTTTRQAQAERTRAELLDAARDIFAARGYEGASVGDVAAAAGYTKGAVYANFESKEDLLRHIVRDLADTQNRWFADQSGRALRDVFADACDPEISLSATLLSLELYAYAVRHSDARADLAPYLASSWDHSARAIASARVNGGRIGRDDVDIEPTQDDRDTALTVLSVLTFAQVLEPIVGDGSAIRSAARIIERHIAPAEK